MFVSGGVADDHNVFLSLLLAKRLPEEQWQQSVGKEGRYETTFRHLHVPFRLVREFLSRVSLPLG